MPVVLLAGPKGRPAVEASELEWTSNSPAYLPIIPGAAGHGMATTAGSGRHSIANGLAAAVTIHFVTNLNLFGAGSLKAALQASGPRIIIPTVSGLIDYGGQAEGNVDVNGPDRVCGVNDGQFIYAGQCAPSPGLAVRGLCISIQSATGACLIWHLTSFQDVYANQSSQLSYGDCIQVVGSANIVVANCSVGWGSDELLDFNVGVDGLTIWQSLLFEPLANVPVLGTNHGYGLLVGSDGTGASVLRNVFVHSHSRNPLTRAPLATIADCVLFNYENRGIELQNENSITSQTNIECNVFLSGPNSPALVPVFRQTGGAGIYLSGSTFYLADNRALGYDDTTQAGLVASGAGTMVGGRITAAYPAGYAVTNSGTREEKSRLVMRYAGARPADRLPTIQRVLDYAEARLAGVGDQGSTSDTPTEAGGFPTIASNSVDHTTGGDPIPGITTQSSTPTTLGTAGRTIMASGYTAIEEWLHRRHDDVMP